MKHDSAIFSSRLFDSWSNKSWSGFSKKLVQPPQMANYFRMVLQSLSTPKFEDTIGG